MQKAKLAKGEVKSTYEHRHAAHCESGVMSSLLRHYGLEISEPMAFGIASAMHFIHLPFMKVEGFPLTAYRHLPGTVIKTVQKSLGVKMALERFRTPNEGTAALDQHIRNNRIVGVQASVFWLPYFPPDMRFHFNAHNLIVYAKQAEEYLISDPVGEFTVTCAVEDLQKARFVKGVFAPRGLLYYPTYIPDEVDLGRAIKNAIRKLCKRMLYTPLPFFGVRGIRFLGNKLIRMEAKHLDPRFSRLYVGMIVRMQEEIGTGGGGFRFMYASFLQESGKLLDNDELLRAAELMSTAGDTWREFALKGARFCQKKRDISLSELGDAMHQCGHAEQNVFKYLDNIRI